MAEEVALMLSFGFAGFAFGYRFGWWRANVRGKRVIDEMLNDEPQWTNEQKRALIVVGFRSRWG